MQLPLINLYDKAYPVLIVGTAYFDWYFYPFGLVVCTDEKTADFHFIFSSTNIGCGKINESLFKPEVFVSDTAGATREACEKVFGKRKIVIYLGTYSPKLYEKHGSLILK